MYLFFFFAVLSSGFEEKREENKKKVWTRWRYFLDPYYLRSFRIDRYPGRDLFVRYTNDSGFGLIYRFITFVKCSFWFELETDGLI